MKDMTKYKVVAAGRPDHFFGSLVAAEEYAELIRSLGYSPRIVGTEEKEDE